MPPLTSEQIQSMLSIMPSPSLLQHEWQKHGSCTGLDAPSYLALIQKAYQHIQIPPRYKNISQTLTESTAQLKADLFQTNPSVTPDQLRIQCKGHYLSDIYFCVDKSLQPHACGYDVHDRCSSDPVILRPLH